MKERTYFSIIMPVYNDEKNISQAIESIINQSYKNWELIIIDDCSTEDSYNIAKRYASKNKKIRTYKMDKNRGVSYCRNFGVQKANNNWIGNADSDIIAPKDWLEKANKYTHKEADIFGGRYIYLKNTYKRKYSTKVFFYLEEYLFPKSNITYNKKDNFKEPSIVGGNCFYKKNIFNNLGGFNTMTKVGEDRLFSSLAIEKGYTVMYISSLFVYHPLYNYNNLRKFFQRTIFFAKWKNIIFNKSKLMKKPYKKVPYLFFSLLALLLSAYMIFGLLNTIKLILGLIILFFLSYSIKLLIKDKIPLKYALGFILVDIINKGLSSIIYLLKIKPKYNHWK